jgi:hypothetical protein
MNRNPWLVAGLGLLLVLLGCSKKNSITNVKGLYAPVITGLHADREPLVRGQDNQLTVLVTNVNGIALAYHWKASGGVLKDSTAQSVRWTAPDSIGTYDLDVSVTGSDETQGTSASYFKQQTFHLFVDNDYTRWTSGETVKLEPAPPLSQNPDFAHPLLYTELVDPSSGQSHIVGVGSPLDAPVALTDPFFQATSPTLRADGNMIAFAGKALSTDPGFSIYLIPTTGAGPDTTLAVGAFRYKTNFNTMQGDTRFSRTGTMLEFTSDSGSTFNPKPWVRDVSNLGVAAYRLIPIGQQSINSFVQTNWNGTGDSIICVSFRQFGTGAQKQRGLFKFKATLPIPDASASLAGQWLPDSSALEPDWSADGVYVVYAKMNAAGDRDIWVIRSDTSDKTSAIRVTYGPADDSHPRFSSDGRSIYFISNRGDRYGLNGIFGTERRGYNVWSVSGFDLPQ